MSVNDERARLASQIAEPVFTGDMTRAEREAEMERWLAACQAQSKRLDEEHMLLGIGRSAAVYMTHEITGEWLTATAGRWYHPPAARHRGGHQGREDHRLHPG